MHQQQHSEQQDLKQIKIVDSQNVSKSQSVVPPPSLLHSKTQQLNSTTTPHVPATLATKNRKNSWQRQIDSFGTGAQKGASNSQIGHHLSQSHPTCNNYNHSQKQLVMVREEQNENQDTVQGQAYLGRQYRQASLRVQAQKRSEPQSFDCIAKDDCVWKKRYFDLVREKETVQKKLEQSLASMETRCSDLTDQKLKQAQDYQDKMKLLLKRNWKFNEIINNLQASQRNSAVFNQAATPTSANDDKKDSSPGMVLSRIQSEQQANHRQSEMLPSQNRPLQSEILMASSRKSRPDERNSDSASTIQIPFKPDFVPKIQQNSISLTQSGLYTKNGVIQEEITEDFEEGDKIELGLLKGDQESGFSQTSSSPYVGGIETPTAYDGTGMAQDQVDHLLVENKQLFFANESNLMTQNANQSMKKTISAVTNQISLPTAMQKFVSNNEMRNTSPDQKAMTTKQGILLNFQDQTIKETPSFQQNLDKKLIKPQIVQNNLSATHDARVFGLNKNKQVYQTDQNVGFGTPTQQIEAFFKKDSPDQNQQNRPKPQSGKKYAEDLLNHDLNQNHSSSGFDSSLNCRISSQKTVGQPGGSLKGDRLVEVNHYHVSQDSSGDRSHSNKEKDFAKKINKPPVDRYESDEIELRDETDSDSFDKSQGQQNNEKGTNNLLQVPSASKQSASEDQEESPVIDFDDQSDDCAFKSLEGQATENSSLGSVPKTQLKFNQTVDQLNRMNSVEVSQQIRVREMHERALRQQTLQIKNNENQVQIEQKEHFQQMQNGMLTEITEEANSEFATTLIQESNKMPANARQRLTTADLMRMPGGVMTRPSTSSGGDQQSMGQQRRSDTFGSAIIEATNDSYTLLQNHEKSQNSYIVLEKESHMEQDDKEIEETKLNANQERVGEEKVEDSEEKKQFVFPRDSSLLIQNDVRERKSLQGQETIVDRDDDLSKVEEELDRKRDRMFKSNVISQNAKTGDFKVHKVDEDSEIDSNDEQDEDFGRADFRSNNSSKEDESKSESVVQFEGRFSTQMSQREKSNLMHFQKIHEARHAGMDIPKSHSQIISSTNNTTTHQQNLQPVEPVISTPLIQHNFNQEEEWPHQEDNDIHNELNIGDENARQDTEEENEALKRQKSPNMQLVHNQRANLRRPVLISNSLTLPANTDLGLTFKSNLSEAFNLNQNQNSSTNDGLKQKATNQSQVIKPQVAVDSANCSNNTRSSQKRTDKRGEGIGGSALTNSRSDSKQISNVVQGDRGSDFSGNRDKLGDTSEDSEDEVRIARGNSEVLLEDVSQPIETSETFGYRGAAIDLSNQGGGLTSSNYIENSRYMDSASYEQNKESILTNTDQNTGNINATNLINLPQLDESDQSVDNQNRKTQQKVNDKSNTDDSDSDLNKEPGFFVNIEMTERAKRQRENEPIADVQVQEIDISPKGHSSSADREQEDNQAREITKKRSKESKVIKKACTQSDNYLKLHSHFAQTVHENFDQTSQMNNNLHASMVVSGSRRSTHAAFFEKACINPTINKLGRESYYKSLRVSTPLLDAEDMRRGSYRSKMGPIKRATIVGKQSVAGISALDRSFDNDQISRFHPQQPTETKMQRMKKLINKKKTRVNCDGTNSELGSVNMGFYGSDVGGTYLPSLSTGNTPLQLPQLPPDTAQKVPSNVSKTRATRPLSQSIFTGIPLPPSKQKNESQTQTAKPGSNHNNNISQQLQQESKKRGMRDRTSFVSGGSPIAEESACVDKFPTSKEVFIGSPARRSKKNYFNEQQTQSQTTLINSSQQVIVGLQKQQTLLATPITGLMGTEQKSAHKTHKSQNSIAAFLSEGVKKIWDTSKKTLEEEVSKRRKKQQNTEDLKWFSQQIEARTFQSDFLFEKYLVAGCSNETLKESAEQMQDETGDKQIQQVEPSVLFTMPSSTKEQSNFSGEKCLVDQETLEVIQDFCFPDGVLIGKLPVDTEKSLSDQEAEIKANIDQILWAQDNSRLHTFVFTLDAADSIQQISGNQGNIYGDSHLFCLVNKFLDLQIVDGNFYTVEKAVCAITSYPTNLDLLHQMIGSAMNFVKEDRSQELLSAKIANTNALVSQMSPVLSKKYEEPTSEIMFLLEQVRCYMLNMELDQEISEITLKDLQNSTISLDYHFPQSVQKSIREHQQRGLKGLVHIGLEDVQYDLLEYHWHMPVLLSLFGPTTFFKLLTAVLLERSIVFVHDSPTILSSTILALKILLRPFQWCHSIIPVLPRVLLEHILQPLPVLVGITREDYCQVLQTTTESERRFKSWIFLDQEWCHQQDKDPQKLPFEGSDEVEVKSGVRLCWGTLDQDLTSDFRAQILMRWAEDLTASSEKHFHLFDKYALGVDANNLRATDSSQYASQSPIKAVSVQGFYSHEMARNSNTEIRRTEMKLPFKRMNFDPHSDQITHEKNLVAGNESLELSQNKIQKESETDFTPEKQHLQSTEISMDKNQQTLNEQGDESLTLPLDQMQVNNPETLKITLQKTESEDGIVIAQKISLDSTSAANPYTSQNLEQKTNENHSREHRNDNFQEIYVTTGADENDFAPMTWVANQKQKEAIDQLVLLISRSYKTKIIEVVGLLCQKCHITEADQIIDPPILADEWAKLAGDDRDIDFLQKFVYTQAFAFLVENYLAARDLAVQKQGSAEGGLLDLGKESLSSIMFSSKDTNVFSRDNNAVRKSDKKLLQQRTNDTNSNYYEGREMATSMQYSGNGNGLQQNSQEQVIVGSEQMQQFGNLYSNK